ncbi:hypothetical protein DFJ77DRAFT_300061 [Powellomyces hirtus]|nr:hypothetical protein DFJ77DRAFT_300061 [Powellomyces hirtus]
MTLKQNMAKTADALDAIAAQLLSKTQKAYALEREQLIETMREKYFNQRKMQRFSRFLTAIPRRESFRKAALEQDVEAADVNGKDGTPDVSGMPDEFASEDGLDYPEAPDLSDDSEDDGHASEIGVSADEEADENEEADEDEEADENEEADEDEEADENEEADEDEEEEEEQ